MKIGFFKRFSTIAATVVCFSIMILKPCSGVAEETSDSKVALVNGTVINQAEFDRELMAASRQFLKNGAKLNQQQLLEFRKQVLESLIGQELILQESSKKGIKVEDKTINEELAKMKQKYPNEEAFNTALKKASLSENKLKSDLRKKMVIQKYIDDELALSTNVSDEEIKSFYDSHPESFTKPEQVRARHILIKVDSNAGEAQKKEARKKLAAVQARLKKGEDFAELAKKFSEGPSKSKGGDLGLFRRGQMVKPFEEVAFALPVGQVSDIVETQFGYHLIKVEEKIPASIIKFDEIKERLKAFLQQRKIGAKVQAHIAQLKEKAKIERFLE
jgi:peptidyl-prolyl cis-trans isomerase C